MTTIEYANPADSYFGFRLEPHILKQAARLGSLSRRELEHALAAEARVFDPTSTEYRTDPEALVYVLRQKFGSGDAETGWMLAGEVLDRSAATIFRYVTCWNLPAAHSEDCIRDIQMEALIAIRTEVPESAFWAVRFGFCLKRLAINVLDRYRRVAVRERQGGYGGDSESDAEDPIEASPAEERLNAQDRAEIRAALSTLAPDQCTAFVLYHYEELDQREIAARLGKTDRTVRNLIRGAERQLEPWRDKPPTRHVEHPVEPWRESSTTNHP